MKIPGLVMIILLLLFSKDAADLVKNYDQKLNRESTVYTLEFRITVLARRLNFGAFST